MEIVTVLDVLRTFCRDELPQCSQKAQANFIGCLIPALVGALPYFLDSLIQCLQGNGDGGSTGHNPGTRIRCND